MTVDLPEINFFTQNDNGNDFIESEDEDETEVAAEYFRFGLETYDTKFSLEKKNSFCSVNFSHYFKSTLMKENL